MMPPSHIELTPEWLQSLFKHCLNADYQLHQVDCDGNQLSYMTSKQPKLWRRLESVQNYYVTLTGPTHPTSEEETEQLLQSMFKQQWHLAHWGPLELNGQFTQQLLSFLSKSGYKVQIEPAFVNWSLNVETLTLDDYFAQRPSLLKSTLKRKAKRLQRSFSQVQFELCNSENGLEQVLNDYESIYEKSWKPEEGSQLFIREFCQKAARQGWLRFGLLRVDGIPIAAQIWFVYQGEATIFKLAYDPTYQAFSPGSLLTEYLMRHVLEQDRVARVDFGMGDEAYKSDWMNTKQTRYTITAYNKGLAGQLAYLRFSCLPAIKKRLTLHD